MKIKKLLKWSASAIALALMAWFLVSYWTSTNDCERLSATPANPMKAIVYCDYGSADVLRLADIEKPVPKDYQVLVKVHAASVNPYDWHFVQGTPLIMRGMGVGLRKPKSTRLGVDYAGTVEAVGKDVTEFKPGDEVFGGGAGSFAEYICARAAGSMTLKPAGVSFEEAASLPIAAVTALQGLRDKGKVQAGQKVLINGASGGVGTFAVQLAKSMGAEVTGVCSTRNLDFVKSLGADHVIDYTKEDFAKGAERYDVILDNVPNHSLSECRHILTPHGKYVMIGGGGPNDNRWVGPFGRVIQASVMSLFIDQGMGMMMANLDKRDLSELAGLIESGKMKPVIDRRYKLSEVPDAIRYLEEGHARGKVIITVD